jgi:putative transcriptional regulator
MPGWRKPTKAETWERRAAIAAKARAGTLRLPHAVVEMRHALGLSQPEFAKLFKLTTRQVSDIERGKANPTAATLLRIGRPFGFQIGFVSSHSVSEPALGSKEG